MDDDVDPTVSRGEDCGSEILRITFVLSSILLRLCTNTSNREDKVRDNKAGFHLAVYFLCFKNNESSDQIGDKGQIIIHFLSTGKYKIFSCCHNT